MKSSEHRYEKAHGFIQQKRLDESYALFKILSVILFLLFSTSAFVIQRGIYNDPLISSLETQATQVETLEDTNMISLEELDDESSSFNESENNSDESVNNSGDDWGFSLDHQTEVVPDLEAAPEKPVISAKIARLIEITNAGDIDIEASYIVVG